MQAAVDSTIELINLIHSTTRVLPVTMLHLMAALNNSPICLFKKLLELYHHNNSVGVAAEKHKPIEDETHQQLCLHVPNVIC